MAQHGEGKSVQDSLFSIFIIGCSFFVSCEEPDTFSAVLVRSKRPERLPWPSQPTLMSGQLKDP
jgi:hypothetical protein